MVQDWRRGVNTNRQRENWKERNICKTNTRAPAVQSFVAQSYSSAESAFTPAATANSVAVISRGEASRRGNIAPPTARLDYSSSYKPRETRLARQLLDHISRGERWTSDVPRPFVVGI